MTAKLQAEAHQISARAVKLPLGAGTGSLTRDQLSAFFSGYPVPVLIENDQTGAGHLNVLDRFFSRYDSVQGLAGMTFDMANWLWVAEDAYVAAQQLGQFVSYCHVKAATPFQNLWQTIGLDQSNGEWRALLKYLSDGIPLGIEFPLEGENLLNITSHYVALLRSGENVAD